MTWGSLNSYSKKKFQLLKLSALKKSKKDHLKSCTIISENEMVIFPKGHRGKEAMEQMDSLFPYGEKNISTPCKNILIGLPSGKPIHVHKG